MLLYSTVPTAAPASIGVKRKKFLGLMTVTSYLEPSIVFTKEAAPQPVPRTTTFSRGADAEGGEGREEVGGDMASRAAGTEERELPMSSRTSQACIEGRQQG